MIHADITIAGGSYAGLALAASLAEQSGGDLRVCVVSPDFPRLGQPPTDLRASALSRSSLRLLTHLGVWPALEPKCQPVTSIVLTDTDLDDAIRAPRLTYDLQTDDGNSGTGHVLPRMVIVENHFLGVALLEAAASAPGITMRRGNRIAAFNAGPDHTQVTLENSEVFTTRLLVAADGGRSKLRDLAGIHTIGHPYEQTGMITIVETQHAHHGRAVQHFLPAGPFALLPMTQNRTCVTWTETATEARRILALDPLAFRLEVEKRFGHRLGALLTISPPRSWPLTLALARSLIAPRFALVGDAAHTVHPIAGQGLNLGFRDIAALAEVIVDTARLGLDFGQASTLERYERWRRFDNLASAAGFDALNSIFATKSTIARSARGAVLSLADSLPGLKSWLIDEASGEGGAPPRLMR